MTNSINAFITQIRAMSTEDLDNLRVEFEFQDEDFLFSPSYYFVKRELCRRQRLTNLSVPERGSD